MRQRALKRAAGIVIYESPPRRILKSQGTESRTETEEGMVRRLPQPPMACTERECLLTLPSTPFDS